MKLQLSYQKFFAVLLFNKDGSEFTNSKRIGKNSFFLDRIVQNALDVFLEKTLSEGIFYDLDDEALSVDICENEIFPILTLLDTTTFNFYPEINYEFVAEFELPSGRKITAALNGGIFDDIVENPTTNTNEFDVEASAKIWDKVWNETFNIYEE